MDKAEPCVFACLIALIHSLQLIIVWKLALVEVFIRMAHMASRKSRFVQQQCVSRCKVDPDLPGGGI